MNIESLSEQVIDCYRTVYDGKAENFLEEDAMEFILDYIDYFGLQEELDETILIEDVAGEIWMAFDYVPNN